MKNVMLDLETCGTTPGSVILSIGAVRFDAETGELGPEFYRVLYAPILIRDYKCTISFDTLVWWARQGEDARRVLLDANTYTIYKEPHYVLEHFTEWLATPSYPQTLVWGNGASFDNTLLQDLYAKLGMEDPWNYYNDRCYRTLKNLFPEIKLVRQGTHHNALDDAKSQAAHAIALLRALENLHPDPVPVPPFAEGVE